MPTVSDYRSLIAGVSPNAEIHILEPHRDGITQITEILQQKASLSNAIGLGGLNPYDALHLISHGSPGNIHLGNTTLKAENIATYQDLLQQWQAGLSEDADINIYGCNVAAAEGTIPPWSPLLEQLHQLTGADIAAYDDLTGNAASGGDWELEAQVGTIESQSLNFANYQYTLAPTGTVDSLALNVSATLTSPNVIDVLANDTGTGRPTAESTDTTGTNGTVIIKDRIYAGGNSNTIGGETRNRIAKLNPDGSVDATSNPDADGTVSAITPDSSGNPYAGGNSNTTGGETRNHIAKLNSDGSVDATFNPNASDGVWAIAIDPKRDILYTPTANFNGVDTFTYTAKDSTGTSSANTVTVLVNDSPALDNSATTTLTAINQGAAILILAKNCYWEESLAQDPGA